MVISGNLSPISLGGLSVSLVRCRKICKLVSVLSPDKHFTFHRGVSLPPDSFTILKSECVHRGVSRGTKDTSSSSSPGELGSVSYSGNWENHEI